MLIYSGKDPSGSASSALRALAEQSAPDDAMDDVNYHVGHIVIIQILTLSLTLAQSDGDSDYSGSSSGTSKVNDAAIGINNMTINPSLPPAGEEVYGCAYLQMIREQLNNYPTTGGEYLDAIFTHREILCAYPVAHRNCARAFSDLAYSIEQRAWRADRDADTEAVTAFRHEAWMIASTL